jgi:thymidine kinase
MFSGKTTALLSLFEQIKDPSTCMLIKPSYDTRYAPGVITTHDGKVCSCTTVSEDISTLVIPDTITYLFIDEAQFFSGLGDFITQHSSVQHVVMAGLMYDCKQEHFGELHKLQYTQEITQLESDCFKCHSTHGKHTLQSIEYGGNTRRVSNAGYFVVCDICLIAYNNRDFTL